MGVARDNYSQDGQTYSFVASFAEVEVDVETGSFKILDFLAVADVGTVIHPKALGGQIMGRSMLGIAHAIGQKWVFDQHLGAPLAKRFLQQQAAHHSRCADQYGMGRTQYPRSGNAGGRSRRWRASGRRRLLRDSKRTFRCGLVTKYSAAHL